MAQESEAVRQRELVKRGSKVVARRTEGMLPVCKVSGVGGEENDLRTLYITSLTKRAFRPRPPQVRLKDMSFFSLAGRDLFR